MRVPCALLVGAAAGIARLVDKVRCLVPQPLDTQGGRAAAVHVERILRVEVLHQELCQLLGGHPVADGRTTVHDEHDEMMVLREGHRRAGMPLALVMLRFLEFRLFQLLRE